jgi:hypothetical protein
MNQAFRKLTSMELDDEDKLDAMPVLDQKPDYPYGLRICLTGKEFEKLDLDPRDAERGAIFHGHFLARVTAVSDTEGGCRVEAQIEDLAIESEDEEDAEYD